MSELFDSKFEAHIERVISEERLHAPVVGARQSQDHPDERDSQPDMYVCTDCGHLGYPVNVTRGELYTEALLWMALVVPGMLYSVWRLTTRSRGCALCQGRHVIPAESPIGRKLLAELEQR